MSTCIDRAARYVWEKELGSEIVGPSSWNADGAMTNKGSADTH